MAVKIKLKRIGKMREPHYRIVVADARTKRSGRAIEEIGQYHPKEDPSVILLDSERAQYWLGVGAQPTEAVAAILRVTGDWQAFRGEPAPAPMQVAHPKADKKATFEAAAKEGTAEPAASATTPKAKRPKASAKVAEPVEAQPVEAQPVETQPVAAQPAEDAVEAAAVSEAAAASDVSEAAEPAAAEDATPEA